MAGRSKQPRIALVHEWLVSMRGAEKILEIFLELYPEAPIFTLVHKKGAMSKAIESRKIHTSFIQELPFGVSHYRHYLPLMPAAIESLDLSDYDHVLSMSNCVGRGVVTRPDATHVTYCNTPMRYVWEQQGDYFGEGKASAPVRAVATLATSYLRTWDEAAARRPDHYISNSHNIARRVKKRYGIDSEVIYPPANCSRFPLSTESRKDAPYVMLTAFAPYKRVDLAIEAFTRMNKRLIIAGGGQEGAKLKSMLKPGGPVEMLGELPGEKLAAFLQNGRAFIFPGEEDFGIAPVEAQSCGTPVIAYGRGGALETVVGLDDPKGRAPTGLFFEDQTVEGLIDAVEQFERREADFAPEAIHQNALLFDRPVIKEQLRVSLDRYFGV